MILAEYRDFIKTSYREAILYIAMLSAFALFLWGLCHLRPGDRLYQRKAKSKAALKVAGIERNNKINPIPAYAGAPFNPDNVHDSRLRKNQSKKSRSD